jgi:hypothetical protein
MPKRLDPRTNNHLELHRRKHMKSKILLLSLLWLPSVVSAQTLPQGDISRMEALFRELPMEAKRLTGPLFWLHGSES